MALNKVAALGAVFTALRPILFAFMGCLLIARQAGADNDISFGSWTVGSTDDATSEYAGSFNDSGGYIGEYCMFSDGNCVWLLGLQTSCEAGSKYPVLVNASAGAYSMEVLCEGRLATAGGAYFKYAFANFDSIANLIKAKGDTIGLAFPMQSGQFEWSDSP